MYLAYDACDVLACGLLGHVAFPSLGIAYVVEVNTVHVVALRYLAADVGQVVGRLCVLWIHVSVGVYLSHYALVTLAQLAAAECVPFSQGQRNYPGMQFHAASVAFFYGKLQGIVAR